MPRPRNKNSCNTCRRRKLKCSLHSPVCDQCKKSGRYCDRSEKSLDFVQFDPQETATVDVPRHYLEDQNIARLFHNYVSNVSQWYDLSDASRSFGVLVSAMALDEPLLFHATIALSAMHMCKVSMSSLRPLAEEHHTRCVKLLIELESENELVRGGIALAATCLLRSYEILSGDTDPNVHLRGAYSMASVPGLFATVTRTPLLEAGFWNYLREDITFSLFERCPLKMDLETSQPLLDLHSDQGHLNAITLVLGRIINDCFRDEADNLTWSNNFDSLCEWHQQLPAHMLPYSRQNSSTPFPTIWLLQSCHASALHYYLVGLLILAIFASEAEAKHLSYMSIFQHETLSKSDFLHHLALDICGIAFTAKTPSVLVNAFGPMGYCCRFLQGRAAREELQRQLLACKRDIGWPVERLIDSLKASWE